MESVPDVNVVEDDGRFVLLGDNADGAGWPCWRTNGNADEAEEFDLPAFVSQHLAKDEVAIFMEVGAEKLRYLVGYAVAINDKGKRKTVSLGDIYKQAEKLVPKGIKIATAEY
ncbi:MAG: hypothetical protein ACYDHY_15975 [Acidiferrobacterales bacterium]